MSNIDSTAHTFPTFTDAGLAAVRAGAERPLLLTNATVHTFDPLIGTMREADVLIGGTLIVRTSSPATSSSG